MDPAILSAREVVDDPSVNSSEHDVVGACSRDGLNIFQEPLNLLGRMDMTTMTIREEKTEA